MDLNAPLGMKPPTPRRRLVPILGAVALALCIGAFGLYMIEADPRGGEPYAVAVIPPAPAPAPLPPATTDPTPTGSIGTDRPAPDGSVRVENGVKVISPQSADRSPGSRDAGPLIIDVTKALDGAARKTASTEGLPRTNAAPAATPAARPRIAIFVSGMGLNAAATRAAIDTLPAAVSLAFLPYGAGLHASVDSARAKGHEILLQLPMQNADGAAVPGPHTLRADESAPETASDLSWLMGRFSGFVGVTNLLGAPVTANREAMTTVLRSVGQHGLFYLDDGTSRRSVVPTLAASLAIPAAQADVVLDATSDPAVVRANLDRLATLARTKGVAIGMASGFPDHLALIARFALELDAQGLALVPVSAIANDGASLATTR